MPTQAVIQVSLSPERVEFVNSRIQSGRYASTEALVEEALRLLEQRDSEREAALREIREKIEEGYQAALRGELVDGEEFIEDLLQDGAEQSGENADEPGQVRETREIEVARAHVRRLINEGLDQADRGELLDGEAVMDELERQLEDRSRPRAAHP